MAEEIGSIEARITADTSDFTRGLLAAEAEAKAFAFDVNKVGTNTHAFGDALKYSERASMDAGKAIGDAARLIDQTDKFLSNTTRDTDLFTRASIAMTGVIGRAPGLFSSFIGVLTSLPVLITAAAVAFVAFIDIVGDVIAIVGASIAPFTLVLSILGLLGAGFLIAGKKAAAGGGHLNEFSNALATLHSMFDRTSGILAHLFLPLLVDLAHAAMTALNYIDKLAHMNLADAMHDIATRGVRMFSDFIDGIASTLSKPIRLAFKIAFDQQSTLNQQISDWWSRLGDYVGGYSVTHPVEIRPGVFRFETKTVDGIFQPLRDWFNKHHFEKEGTKIGHSLLGGFTDSEASDRIGHALVTALEDAFKIIGRGFMHKLGELRDGINKWGQNADHTVEKWFGQAWDWVKTKAVNVFDSIKTAISNKVGDAIDTVKGLAQDFLDILHRIANFFSHPLSLSIDWPSPPSWLTNLPGFLGGGAGSGGGSAHPDPQHPSGGGTSGTDQARIFHVHLMVGEREFGQAIIDTQRVYGRHNAGRMLTA